MPRFRDIERSVLTKKSTVVEHNRRIPSVDSREGCWAASETLAGTGPISEHFPGGTETTYGKLCGTTSQVGRKGVARMMLLSLHCLLWGAIGTSVVFLAASPPLTQALKENWKSLG